MFIKPFRIKESAFLKGTKKNINTIITINFYIKIRKITNVPLSNLDYNEIDRIMKSLNISDEYTRKANANGLFQ